MRQGGPNEPPAFERVGHVQLSMPPAAEDDMRHFYGTVLGMAEIAKPPVLAKRGGAWFRSGRVEIHLGVEREFRPARKAHPAIQVGDVDAMATRLAAFGANVEWDGAIPTVRRFHVRDPAGNRLEFVQPER